MSSVTIIMYHYVRERKHSRYPKIKALETSKFKDQINYLKKNYSIISAEDCLKAVTDHSFSLPPNPALLTFDDGYIDHSNNVFPILDSYSLPGCFFVPVKTVKNHEVLDVNKIHFILAAADNTNQLIGDINKLLVSHKEKYKLNEPAYYFKKLAGKDRYDSKEIIFIKRLLQKELQPELRTKIIDYLFKKYVTEDEEAFSRELYMNMDQIKHMVKNGMYVGGHGYDHFWMDQLTQKQQENEVSEMLKFLNEVGSPIDQWIMCYPYGAYNHQLIQLLKQKNCALGLTTKVGKAQLTVGNAFTLERFDTNDLQNVIANKPSVMDGDSKRQ